MEEDGRRKGKGVSEEADFNEQFLIKNRGKCRFHIEIHQIKSSLFCLHPINRWTTARRSSACLGF